MLCRPSSSSICSADIDTFHVLVVVVCALSGDVQALRLLADAVADASIERLQDVLWDAKDRWGDTPLQVRGMRDREGKCVLCVLCAGCCCLDVQWDERTDGATHRCRWGAIVFTHACCLLLLGGCDFVHDRSSRAHSRLCATDDEVRICACSSYCQ
jgi:hypothetical protein